MAPVRVLIADAHQDSAETLAGWLELCGYETLIARDGKQALELAAASVPDICVLELALPQLDGCEVARRVRDGLSGNKTLLIAHTAWTTARDRKRAFQCGFDHFIVKPAEPAELLRILSLHHRTPAALWAISSSGT